MEPQTNSKSKMVSTENQRATLQMYRVERGMISTRQHDLISSCHTETGLPEKFIKQWIGNQNSKERGTRKGGSQYKTSGKPRVLSGYNIFCSEVKAPEDILAQGFSAQNSWWSSRWNQMTAAERESYNVRANEAAKATATEQLTGEALDHRKNYLLKELANLCDNLSKAGVEVAAYAVEEGEEELFTGSNIGIKFMKSRSARSSAICREFESFVQHAKFSRTVQLIDVVHSAPDDAQDETTVAVDPTAQVENPDDVNRIDEPEPSAVVLEQVEPQENAIRSPGGFLHTLNVILDSTLQSNEVTQQGAVMEDSVQAVNIETGPITPFHQPSQQGGTSGENFTTPMNSSIELNIDPMPSTRVTKQTALEILLPMSNGGSVSEDEMLCENATAPTKIPKIPFLRSVDNKKRGRKPRKPDAMVGKAIEQLWTMEDDQSQRWYRGTVIERSGKKYKIKYAEEEELFSINVANFKKGLKERTIRLL